MTVNHDLLASIWVWFGATFYVCCMITAWYLYGRSRPLDFSLVTDGFALFFAGLWGPAMLFYMFLQFPVGVQPAYSGLVDPNLIFFSLIILSAGILSVVVGFILAEAVFPKRIGALGSSLTSAPLLCFVIGFGYCVAFVALILAHPDGRFFLSSAREVLRATSYDDYTFLRRYAMRDSFLFSEILTRARFSLNAFMYTLACVGLIRLRGLPTACLALGPCIVFLVCSISKAPYVYYVLYPLLGYSLLRAPRARVDRFIVRRLALAGGLAVVMMVGLYLVQYGHSEESELNVVSALALTSYRVFGASADALRLYLAAYPDRFDFGMGAGFSFIAAMLGQPVRDYATEIVAMAGADLVGETTYPTIYLAGAYAEFAIPGVILYSLVIGAYLSVVQRLVARLQILEVRIACTATLLLNLSFLLTLPAPASFLSYGIGSIPLIALALDWLARVLTGRSSDVSPAPRLYAYDRS